MRRLRFENGPLDATDAALLGALARDARATMADLARAVGLSAPSVAERVRRLEEAGVIRGYAAVVDTAALGLPIVAHIRIRPMPGLPGRVAELLPGLPAVVECDRVTGEDCFVARAHVRSAAELEALIDQLLPYAVTDTSIVQSSPVPRRLPPLGARFAPER